MIFGRSTTAWRSPAALAKLNCFYVPHANFSNVLSISVGGLTIPAFSDPTTGGPKSFDVAKFVNTMKVT